MPWNWWPACGGISGRHQAEYASGFNEACDEADDKGVTRTTGKHWLRTYSSC